MTTTTKTSGMQRRDFLKLMGAGLASAWALSASSTPLTSFFLSSSLAAQTSFGTGLLRGTQDGHILQSLDQGKNWQSLVSFGAHCAIVGLVSRDGQLFAKLALGSNSFWLSTADAKTWRTLGI